MLSWPFASVGNLLSHEDKERLLIMAGYCSSLSGCFVEIGCFEGLSSLVILSFPCDKILYAFDLNLGDVYFRNVSDVGKRHRVRPMHGDFRSHEFNRKVSFAFVDHDHEYDTTRDAWNLLWPLITPGGILAFHDFGHPDYPGGTLFLRENCLTNRTEGSSIVYKMKDRS